MVISIALHPRSGEFAIGRRFDPDPEYTLFPAPFTPNYASATADPQTPRRRTGSAGTRPRVSRRSRAGCEAMLVEERRAHRTQPVHRADLGVKVAHLRASAMRVMSCHAMLCYVMFV